jgi:glycosyltransferase involved in cell wall biosynthesis
MHNRISESAKNLPLASVLLLTFNQEDFIKEALNSLLLQTYHPLEIIIADDCSTDNTQDLIKEIITQYHGPHKIKLSFNEKNLGICANINKALDLCDGELIHLAAGDDISLTNRCEIVMQTWLDLDQKPDLIATNVFDMDFSGNILGVKHTSLLQNYQNLMDWIKAPPAFFGCSHTWSRKLIDKFPPLSSNLSAEDHLMVFRSIINDGAYTIEQPFVKYRRGGISSRQSLPLMQRIKKAEVKHITNMVYFEQLLNDAQNDPNIAILKKFLNPKISETAFAIQMYEPVSTLEKLKTLIKTSHISLGFRVKNFGYGVLPYLHKKYLN